MSVQYSYREAVAYIEDTPRFAVKHTIDDTRNFLKILGNPDIGLPIIHVAGTNGKGSVCAYMRSVLETAGKSVCVFTSPHLVDIRERFVVRGEMISEQAFLNAFHKVLGALEQIPEDSELPRKYHPSYFEFLFLMAMLIFRDAGTDYCILETGLGGRLDATNCVRNKLLSVITRIGLDHTQYLGNTISEIASEKAGSMMPGVPVVYDAYVPEAAALFAKRAKELACPATAVSLQAVGDVKKHKKSIDFSYASYYYGNICLEVSTIAGYQVENVSLALRALEILDAGRTITQAQMIAGVRNCHWQARMEEILPEVYMDGAHNTDGLRAFLDTVACDDKTDRQLLFGVVADKDYREMAQMILASGLFSKIILAQLESYRSIHMEQLKELFAGKANVPCLAFPSVKEALDEALGNRADNTRVYIAGSLYLAGEVKGIIENDQF